MKRVFCIGNGESRKDFPLEQLKSYGKIYGCNAIYRDYPDLIDVLTAVDNGIIHEIYHSGIAMKKTCYFRNWTKVPAMMYESVVNGLCTEDELKDYSDKVRKRIQHFSKGYHDERRAKEAALREREELVSLSKVNPGKYLEEFKRWGIERIERLAREGWRKANVQ